MKKLLTEWREYLNEMKLDIKVGDVLLGGKFKNKRIVVKEIGKDELGQPTINVPNTPTCLLYTSDAADE